MFSFSTGWGQFMVYFCGVQFQHRTQFMVYFTGRGQFMVYSCDIQFQHRMGSVHGVFLWCAVSAQDGVSSWCISVMCSFSTKWGQWCAVGSLPRKGLRCVRWCMVHWLCHSNLHWHWSDVSSGYLGMWIADKVLSVSVHVGFTSFAK